MDIVEGCLEHMKEDKTRTLRVDIPSDLANLLDQVKIISGKKKKDAVISALELFFFHSETIRRARAEDQEQTINNK